MTKHEAAYAVIETKGNCTGINCDDCPIKGECNDNESKAVFMGRARSWIENNKGMTK